MTYAIQLELAFRNTARRDATASNINAKLAASAISGEPTVTNATLRSVAGPGLVVVARFVNQADRDGAWAQLDTLVGTGVNGPVTGSRAWVHDCPHDENVGGCEISELRTW